MKKTLAILFLVANPLIVRVDADCMNKYSIPPRDDTVDTCALVWALPPCCTGSCVRTVISGGESCTGVPPEIRGYEVCDLGVDPTAGTITLYSSSCPILFLCHCFIPAAPTSFGAFPVPVVTRLVEECQ